jgi:hypothetical protein
MKIPEFIVSVASVTVNETHFKATTSYNHIGNPISMGEENKNAGAC